MSLASFAGQRVSLFDILAPCCARSWGASQGKCAGWELDWAGSELAEPTAHVPACGFYVAGHSAMDGSEAKISNCGTDAGYYYYDPALTPAGVVVSEATFRVQAGIAADLFGLRVHTKTGSFYATTSFRDGALRFHDGTTLAITTTSALTVRMVITDATGACLTYVNGTLAWSGSGTYAAWVTYNRASIGKLSATSENKAVWVSSLKAATGADPAGLALLAFPCYGTRSTCQASAVFSLTTRTDRFTFEDGPRLPGVAARRLIAKDGIKLIPTEIDLRRGLGVRDLLTVKIRDCGDPDDVGMDPNITRRPKRTGSSFWRKWIRRNRYHQGATVYLREGFLSADGTLYEQGLSSRRYLIDRIDGPTDGCVTVRCKDLLKELDQADVPAATAAELAAAITTTVATACTVKAGQGDIFGAPTFYFRIDDEIMSCTARTGDGFTTITRHECGTTAATHAIDAKVQLVTVLSGTPDVFWAAFLTLAGIDGSLIDSAGAALETTNWMTGWNLLAYLSDPTRISERASQMLQATNCMTWWDAEAQLCRLRQVRGASPSETVTAWTDRANLVRGSVRLEPMADLRLTRVTIFFGVIDWSQPLDIPSNYSRIVQSIQVAAEGATEYDGIKDLVIYAWPMPATLYNEAAAMAQRLSGNFVDAPTKFRGAVSAKDDGVAAGSVLSLTIDDLVDDDGVPLTTQGIVLSKQRPPGTDNTEYTAATITQAMAAGAFWTDDLHPDWSVASPADRAFGYWCDDSGYVDGTTPGNGLL